MADVQISTRNLRTLVSTKICTMLKDRIIRLKDLGIFGIWMKPDGDDFFNAGTVMGYRGDDWNLIKKHSGLWYSDGRMHPEKGLLKKLAGIKVIRRDCRKSCNSSRSLWFKFDGIVDTDANRSSRTILTEEISSESCTPGDPESLENLINFHKKMENNRTFYATRFSRDLRDLIRSLERLGDDEEEPDELEEGEEEAIPTELERLFFSASVEDQKAIVKKFLYLNKVYYIYLQVVT